LHSPNAVNQKEDLLFLDYKLKKLSIVSMKLFSVWLHYFYHFNELYPKSVAKIIINFVPKSGNFQESILQEYVRRKKANNAPGDNLCPNVA